MLGKKRKLFMVHVSQNFSVMLLLNEHEKKSINSMVTNSL